MSSKAEIISLLDETYLIIPRHGKASFLFMEQLKFFHSINVPLKPFIHKTENIQGLVGPHHFCIELIGVNGSKVGNFIYELFETFINNNLQQEV